MDILLEAGVVSKKNYDITKEIIDFLRSDKKLIVTEENAAAFVTHTCMALERIDRGELVAPLDETVIEAVKEEEEYVLAYMLSSEIQQKYPQLEGAELNYLCMHLGTLLSTQ
jgi:transcriptional regulatory protein LevR